MSAAIWYTVNKKMKKGAIVSFIVAIAAVVGLGFIFVQNASPYLTINQLSDKSTGVHVVGKIVPGSLKQDIAAKEVRFRLSDDTGQMDVVYTGPALSNLSSATQVVVIGNRTGQSFHSEQMLVKCPSKYESNKAAIPAG